MTILYASDWARYPTAIIDTKTKNESFLRLAAVYRSMGIKNHAFILALINPKLQGVDPYDPNLTLEQMGMIAMECKMNFWYYVREVARAPAIGGVGSTYVEANRGNIAAWWLFFNHILYTLIQPRQTGKSFSTDILMTWLLDIGCLSTKINLLTKDDSLRRANIQRIKDIRSEMPAYLRQHTPSDVNNTEEITVDRLKNRYSTHVPQSSPKNAIKLGRGLTTSIFHIDEAPFQPNIAIALPAALAAMGAAVDKSKAEGAPHGTILTTTAGKKDDRDGRFIHKLVSESAIWTEKMFDCANEFVLEKMIRNNARSGKPHVNLTFNHRQLGKTDQWMLSKLEGSLQTGDDANRDYFNMWTSGSQSHPLPIHVLERIAGSLRDVVFTEISGSNGYIIRWYIPEEEIAVKMASGKFVLGMDTSEASGSDDISMVLMDIETLEVIACGTFNETNLITFSHWVAGILIRFQNITAVIERRSTGAMLLDYLLVRLPEMGIDPFKRIFNTVVNDHDEQPERYREIRNPMNRRDPSCYVRYKKTFGYTTSGSGAMSRGALYTTSLNIAAKKAADRVRDKNLIDQINGLITKNGRIDHEEGEHDDMVIGWLLCIWFITQGKNLMHYGIDPKMVMSRQANEQDEDPMITHQRQQQLAIRQKMQELSDLITSSKDDYVVMRLEHDMRVLGTKIIYEEGEIVSVDELIRQAKEKRRFKRDQHYQSSANQNNFNTNYSYGEYYKR